jgi:UDPglucose 6-dehydrogenase
MSRPVIGYAGMTHLGLNSAVAAAEKGFDVVCYDEEASRIAALKKGELPVVEPDLPKLLAKNAKRITFRADAPCLAKCDVVYVAPDVATDDAGQSDLSQINAIIGEIDPVLRADAVLVILSQVPPGFTRALKRDKDRLFYQVETLIFGRAMERALFPERFIVGCAEPAKGLPDSFARFLESFGCPILPMRYESAELAKISINMCLVASVTVANTLAELCESIGADWSEIVPALKLDKRIGAHAYLTPGLGIAGGNLERDLATVCNFAERHGTDARVVRAWIANSGHRKDWPWRTLKAHLLDEKPDARVAVLGLAYKQDTHSTKNSPALMLLAHMNDRPVTVYDPVVKATAAGKHVVAAPTALDAVREADAVCVMTPWSEFKSLAASELASRMRGRLLIDPYSLIDAVSARAAGLTHVTLGVAPESAVPAC